MGKVNDIICPNIILCEGMDEWSFLVNYLEYLIREDETFDTVQVLDFGGIKDLKRQFKQMMLMPGFSNVKSILIIRDAEKDPRGAKDSICSTLKNNGFNVPDSPGKVIVGYEDIVIAYTLFPSCDENCNEEGTLEDLCLKIISETNHTDVLGEIDKYLFKMQNDYSMKYPRIHKNKLHMLISSYDKYVDAKAGEAGQRGLYNWNSCYLTKLRNLMYDLCTYNGHGKASYK